MALPAPSMMIPQRRRPTGGYDDPSTAAFPPPTGQVSPRSPATYGIHCLCWQARPSGTQSLDAAIWPNQQVLAATRVENVSRARKWLGVNSAGASRLLAAPAGSPLRLQAGALLDWELFQRLHKRAEGASSADDAAWDLVNALRLVRGKPFEVIPTGRYSWLAEVYLEQDIPAAVVDAAHHLAGLRLAAGDANGAREAARVAQRVDRYDERPWRDLMEAENLAGDVKRVRELRDELLQLVESVVEDELMPDTQELLKRLLPRDRSLAVS